MVKPSMHLPVPALCKGFDILAVVAKRPGIGFTDIRKALNLPKSSAHTLLLTLKGVGALHKEADGGYVLGLRLFELGSMAAIQRNVTDAAVSSLRRLAHTVQLTCHLGVLEGTEAVYLAKLECEQPIRISSWVGKRVSLHSSSLGKSLLAWLPEAEVDALLEQLEWVKKLPNTIPNQAAYRKHLSMVRAQGWAIDDEEDVRNLRCLGAPVRDMSGRVVAAISMAGTTFQIDDSRIEDLSGRLLSTAHEISQTLGYKPHGPSPGEGE